MSYVALANITLTGNDNQILFSSIPNTYRHLALVMQTRAAGGGLTYPSVRFNNDSGTNYPQVTMGANSAQVYNTTYNFNRIGYGGNSTTSHGHAMTLDIFDYAQTDKQKVFLQKENYYGNAIGYFTGRWLNTAAITSIAIFFEDGSNMASGSTFELFGIAS